MLFPFPMIFSKGSSFRVVKSQDCVVELTHSHTMTPFDAFGKEAYQNIAGKGENAGNQFSTLMIIYVTVILSSANAFNLD